MKNYGRDIKNPEFDQLAGRLTPQRGRVGLLVVRNVATEELTLLRSCDRHLQEGKVCLVLDLDDLARLLSEQDPPRDRGQFHLLRERYLEMT